jgi:hypothetical protein
MTSGSEIWDKIFRKKKEIVSRAIAGETILVPISGKLADMQRIFSLNPAAEYIWSQLNGKRTLQEIRNSVLSAFDVPQNQADTDIEEFIDALLNENLIISQE